MSDIAELLARVEAATGPDRRIDLELKARLEQPGEWSEADIAYALTDVDGTTHPAAYTASIDAAVALVEKMLPGAPWKICSMPTFSGIRGMPWARVNVGEQAFGGTPVLALLAALLRALPSPVHPQED